MKTFAAIALSALLAAPGAASALEISHFQVNKAADLVALCSAQPADQDYEAAIHMCQGFITAVDQFHTAMTMDDPSKGLYCLSGTPPTRNEAMSRFSAWVEATPGAGDRSAVDALVSWAATVYPCN